MSPADEFSRELRNTRGPGSDTGSGRRVTGRETRKIRRMSTHEVWLRNFEQVADAIPESWRVTDPDSLQWIVPAHAGAPIVELHRQLCLVGFANGCQVALRHLRQLWVTLVDCVGCGRPEPVGVDYCPLCLINDPSA